MVVFVSLMAGVFFGYGIKSATEAPQIVQAVTVKPQSPTVDELLRLVNEERTKVGVAPLKIDVRLNASAQMKANDMVEHNYFGHTREGRFVGEEFVTATGIKCALASENLTENLADNNTAQQAVFSWSQSPAHYAAMVDPRYELTGFGVSGNQVVQHFCKT